MKSIIVLLMLLSPSVFAAAPPPVWSFKVYDAGAQPGDPIAYRFAWTNTSSAPLRVPDDMFRQLTSTAEYRFRMINAQAVAPRAIEPLTREASVKWITVRPGESYQELGELSDFFPACKGGCAEGSYTLTLAPAMRRWEPLADDQTDPLPPAFEWKGTLDYTIEAALVPVGAGPGLEVKLAVNKGGGVDREGNVKMRVTVTNRHKVAVWFPKKMVVVDWSVRDVFDDGPGGIARGVTASTGMAAWTLADALLVKPGKSVSWESVVGVSRDAKRSFVTAHVRPEWPFKPQLRGIASRFYFSGALTSPEVQVR